jgi:hypothetical protein
MKYARTARLGAGATGTDRHVSLQEVVAWMRECGELHVVFLPDAHELSGLRRQYVLPARAATESLPARPQGRGRWLAALHDPPTLFQSRYAARYGEAANRRDRELSESVLAFRSRAELANLADASGKAATEAARREGAPPARRPVGPS